MSETEKIYNNNKYFSVRLHGDGKLGIKKKELSSSSRWGKNMTEKSIVCNFWGHASVLSHYRKFNLILLCFFGSMLF
jgi:hypothetical protein